MQEDRQVVTREPIPRVRDIILVRVRRYGCGRERRSRNSDSAPRAAVCVLCAAYKILVLA